MKIHPASTFAIATVYIGLAVLACESPVARDSRPPAPGQFFYGDEATAEVKRLLENAVHTQETLKGPEGARLAASRGLTLGAAITNASESIKYYRGVLEGFSGKARKAQLEDGLRTARGELEVLKGPQGAHHAAGLGMTLTAAIADIENKIEMYGSALASTESSGTGQVDDVGASSNSCRDNKARLLSPSLMIDGPHYDENLDKTIVTTVASQDVWHPARQEIHAEMVIEFGDREEHERIYRRKKTSTRGQCVKHVDDARIVWKKGGYLDVCVTAESLHIAETDSIPPHDYDEHVNVDFTCDGEGGGEGGDGSPH